MKALPKKGFHNLTVSDEVYRLLEAYKTANGLRSLSQAIGKILEEKQKEAAPRQFPPRIKEPEVEEDVPCYR